MIDYATSDFIMGMVFTFLLLTAFSIRIISVLLEYKLFESSCNHSCGARGLPLPPSHFPFPLLQPLL